jgi:hypothetical protein
MKLHVSHHPSRVLFASWLRINTAGAICDVDSSAYYVSSLGCAIPGVQLSTFYSQASPLIASSTFFLYSR